MYSRATSKKSKGVMFHSREETANIKVIEEDELGEMERKENATILTPSDAM